MRVARQLSWAPAGRAIDRRLACLDSPLNYLGDDFILMRANPEPCVFSLYCSAKLHADHWRRFPHLQNMASNASRLESEKALLFIDRTFVEKIRLSSPPRAILLPHVVGTGKTRAYMIPSARALQQLAVSTIFLLHGAGKAEFEALASFRANSLVTNWNSVPIWLKFQRLFVRCWKIHERLYGDA